MACVLERLNLLAAVLALADCSQTTARRCRVAVLSRDAHVSAEVTPADCARKQFETLCDPANSAPAIGSPLIIE
jgi:hypothetical protein